MCSRRLLSWNSLSFSDFPVHCEGKAKGGEGEDSFIQVPGMAERAQKGLCTRTRVGHGCHLLVGQG